MINIFTIGVYGFTEEEFFHTLSKANIDTFCDIRRRRGVRGSKYSFANSKRLQAKLDKLGIKYFHLLDLAPSEETRAIQKSYDKIDKVQKRERSKLNLEFINSYIEECLIDFNPKLFLNKIGSDSKNVLFFCVERDPLACHRSIVADHFRKIWPDLKVNNL